MPPAVQVTSIDRFLRYHIQCCESFRLTKLPACSAAAGRDILTQTIILDMSGLSPMKHFTLTVRNFLHTLSQVDSVRKLPQGLTTIYLCLHVLQLISRRASLPHGRHVTFVCIEHSLTAAGACLAGLALHCWPCPVCTTHSDRQRCSQCGTHQARDETH